MREKLEHLFGDILMGSLKPKSEKLSTKEERERESLQKFLDGFNGFKPCESLQGKLDNFFQPNEK